MLARTSVEVVLMKRLALLAVMLCCIGAGSASAVPRTFVQPPILMYHRIDRKYPRAPFGRVLTVSPAAFAAQLLYLRERRISAVSMAQFEQRLQRKQPLHDVVILTFDDGYADQYRYALPLLRRMDDEATFYIVTGMIGKPGHLTWEMLRTMRDGGMDIAGHGVTHDDLTTLSVAHQRAEIFGCIRSLRQRLAVRVLSYAYPSGRFNADTISLVRAAGIPFGLTTDPRYVRPPQNRYELTRLRVVGSWTLHDFARGVGIARSAGPRVLR